MESRLEIGAASTSRVGGLSLTNMALTPALRYTDRRLSAAMVGTALVGPSAWQLGNATASFEAYTPLLYGIRAEIRADANRAFFEQSVQNDQVNAEGRLHFMRQRGGVWLGSGVSRPLRVTAVSNVNVSSGGIWTRLGTTTLRGSVTSFFFTKAWDTDSLEENSLPCARLATPPTTVSTGLMIASAIASATGCRYQSRLTDLETSVRYDHRLGEITVRGGQRFGVGYDVTPDSRRWASAQIAIWMSNQVAAVAGGGTEPGQPTRGLPARKYASLGLMLAYWPIPRGIVPVETPASLVRAFELRPAGSAVQRISARIGGVETVEIMGDFTDWSPTPLIRRGRDQWELLVPMAPGMHQINLRIDGGQWIAPPGMPSMKDGFNGEVGVVVIKQ